MAAASILSRSLASGFLAWACLVTIPAAAAASAEAQWTAVVNCARQSSDPARHACIDQVLRDAGLLPGNPASPPLPSEPAAAVPTRIETKVASVATSPAGRLTVTANDGSVWRQSETLRIPRPPLPGDRIEIRKGAVGGYICTVGSNPAYRCERAN